ncbi:MAG: autotransporter outer membrane beta-barrel domain-containing protein [Granulosicoccus sp.]|nr:autotransporter outer membrane beta-barrel domain-containing protein [Granulosicoccus sp.]
MSGHAQETLVVDINVIGLNENQTTATSQLGEACESLGNDTSDEALALQAVCDLIDSLDENDPEDLRRLQEIGDAVAIEEAFAMHDSLVAVSDFQTTNVRARLDALREPVLSEEEDWQAGQREVFPGDRIDPLLVAVPDGAQAEQRGGAASGDLFSRLGGFINGHVSSGEMDGLELERSSEISSSSVTFGADYRFSDNVIGGLGLGFLSDDISFRQVAGGAESEGLNITAFASWYESDEGYVDIVLDVGGIDFETERSVAIDSTSSLSAVASPSSTARTITVSGGRTFKPRGWDLGAYFRLSHTRATIDAYTENRRGGEPSEFAAIFSISKQSVVSTKMVVGLEATKVVSTARAVVIPLLRLEYITENDTDKDDIEATLDYTGTTASYRGTDRVSSYSNVGFGASAVFSRGRSAFAFYETHLQHDLATQDWLKFGLRLEF